MTEGQWLWVMLNMQIDNDIQLEKMCGKCKSGLNGNKCTHCNANLEESVNANPNFDESLFEKLKNEENGITEITD